MLNNTALKTETIMNPNINPQDMQKLLDSFYEKCIDGINKISPPVIDTANDYLNKHQTKELSCRAMMNVQIFKCTMSGFLTGLGGLVTLPIALPINIITVLYFQMRMIACLAHMAGLDLHSNEAKTFVYACLAGVSINAALKNTGIKMGVKAAEKLLSKMPAKIMTSVNERTDAKLATKVGAKTAANFSKFMPGVGAVIGALLDYFESRIIAKRAYNWFIKDKFSDDKTKDNVIDIDDYTIE